MRIPWLRVDAEAIQKALSVAAILKISHNEAIGGLVNLWLWVLSEPHHDERPDGWVRGDFAAERIAAATQWKAESNLVIRALVVTGFLTSENRNSMRVRGMSRYARTFEKNSRPNAKMRASGNKARQRPGGGPAKGPAEARQGPAKDLPVDVDVEDLDHIRTGDFQRDRDHVRDQGREFFQNSRAGAGEKPTPTSSGLPPSGQKAREPKPRKLSKSQEAHAWFKRERAKKLEQLGVFGESDKEPTPQAVNAATAAALDELGVPGFKRAVLSYFESEMGRTANPKFAWGLFISDGWRRCKTPEPTANANGVKFVEHVPGEDLYRDEPTTGGARG